MLRVFFQDPDFTCAVGIKIDPKLFDGKVKQWLAGVLFTYARKTGTGASIDVLKIALKRALHTRRLLDVDEGPAQVLLKSLAREVPDRSFVKEELYRFAKNQVVR